LFVRFSLVRIVYVGVLRVRAVDLKSLIAYSSVSHISLVLLGILIITTFRYSGALLIILGHGLCSSGLFYLINLLYIRSLSRRVYINKGVLYLPLIRAFIFFFVIGNISCPPGIGFISEIFLIIRIISYSYFSLVILYLGSFMVAVFSLFFFSIVHRSFSFKLGGGLSKLSFREFHLMRLHLIPLNFLILNFEILI